MRSDASVTLDAGLGDGAVAHPEDTEEAGQLVGWEPEHRVGEDLVLGQRPWDPVTAQQGRGRRPGGSSGPGA